MNAAPVKPYALTDFSWTAPCDRCGFTAGILRNPAVGPSTEHLDGVKRNHQAEPDQARMAEQPAAA